MNSIDFISFLKGSKFGNRSYKFSVGRKSFLQDEPGNTIYVAIYD